MGHWSSSQQMGTQAQLCHIMSPKKSSHYYSMVNVKPSAAICRNLASSGLSLNLPVCPESGRGIKGFQGMEGGKHLLGDSLQQDTLLVGTSSARLPLLAGVFTLKSREPAIFRWLQEAAGGLHVLSARTEATLQLILVCLSVVQRLTHSQLPGKICWEDWLGFPRMLTFLLRWSLHILS